jgi:hypothetical protein
MDSRYGERQIECHSPSAPPPLPSRVSPLPIRPSPSQPPAGLLISFPIPRDAMLANAMGVVTIIVTLVERGKTEQKMRYEKF